MDDARSGKRSAGDGRGEPVSWAPLLAIVAIGAFLRVIDLDADLWLDEIDTLADHMRPPALETLSNYGSANNHLLNSLLGGLCVGLFGESAWAVRLPALGFGIAGIPAVYYLARAVTSERESLLVTALFALSYHHIWFSQNARGYTGMIFFSTLGTALFLRAISANRPRHWVLCATSMALGVMCLLNTAFVVAGLVPAYLAMSSRRGGEGAWDHWPMTRWFLLTLVAIGLLCALEYGLMFESMLEYYAAGASDLGWTNPLEFAAVVFAGLTPGMGGVGILAIAAGCGILAAGCASYWRQSPVVIGLLIAPVAINAIALVVLRFGAYPRSFLYVLPLALLVVVRGTAVLGDRIASNFPPRWRRKEHAEGNVGLALVGIALLASAVLLVHNYRYPKQDYSGALHHALEHAGPEDVVCAVGWAADAYRRYHAPELCFPASREELVGLRREGRAVWVLYSFTRDMGRYLPEVYDYLRADFDLIATFPGTLGDGNLYVVRAEGV